MMMMKSIFVVVAVLLCAATADPVASLPGLGPLPSPLDAGYITVDAASNRSLFYMFIQSTASNAAKAPLVLWLNGGPGCSSLGGLFTEHGPYSLDFNKNGTGLLVNPYSWTNVANMIYLESPAFVGFSYSDNMNDLVVGDERTANDTLAFLKGFLAKFPQYKQNEFWVTGESYGGHYVPELVNAILENNAVDPNPINIVGFMAGNPWTAPDVEAFRGPIDYWWNHGIISRDVYSGINRMCDYKDITFWIVNNVSISGSRRQMSPAAFAMKVDEYVKERMATDGHPSAQCLPYLEKACFQQFNSVDILGIFTDVCVAGTVGNIPDQPNYCANNQLSVYLNLPEVQKALHIRNAPVQWNPCSSALVYNRIDTQTSVLPLYQKFLSLPAAKRLKILVFSGDNDAIVPFSGTREWIELLNLPLVGTLYQWYVATNGNQVGGWAQIYDGLTFTTVRGAGHMVPFAQPERALAMFTRFITNGKL